MARRRDVRVRVKAIAERVLLASGGRAARWRMRDRTLILAYHNVVPDEQPIFGDRSLHLRRSDFAAQLDALRETHDVVPLPAVLLPSHGPRPRAAITFDDAYAGAVTLGVAEVVARGLPATV